MTEIADSSTSMKLIDDALANPRVKALFDEVGAITPINIVESDETTWGSTTKDGQTEISIAATKRPSSALAHELLHAKLKIIGYRQYTVCCSMDGNNYLLQDIIEALDNELQHHRMLPHFMELGFSATDFYHDDDDQAFSYVRAALDKLTSTSHPGTFLLLFLTLIAPGGVGSEDERQKLRNFFKARCGKQTWKAMKKIETQFDLWKCGKTLDPGNTIASILRQLGHFEKTWIGVSTVFPGQGFFVGRRFTEEQLIAWHKSTLAAQ